ncbi:MAG: hypothetical protein BMS9Abin15_0894 [Gammaproteobacteria bacterium]|nr:MAG: hypothetical protein BMS9Abin15_0894 [Gammaproteobacteria bacterium]
MGFGGIGIPSLLLILAIVILIFGTKKLRNMGGDLGGAIKSFRTSMKEGEKTEEKSKEHVEHKNKDDVIEGEVVDKEQDKT